MRRGGRGLSALRIGAGLWLWVAAAHGQVLRFGNHRELSIPDSATVRVGPFYSSIAFSLSAGYRWSGASGAGTAFLRDNEVGAIREDGSEFPIIAALDFRNYVLLTRNMDLDMSFRVSYEYYPLGTQESAFNLDLAEEGIEGSLSTEFRLTSTARGTAYDRLVYRTDYLDTRGLADMQGGRKYTYFQNRIGADTDWMVAKEQNVGISLAREDHIAFEREFEDETRTSYDESVRYEIAVFPDFAVGAGISLTQVDYRDPDRDDLALANVFLIANFRRGDTGGARLRLTENTTLTLTVGYGFGYAFGGSAAVVEGTNAIAQPRFDEQAGTLTGSARLETRLRKDTTHSFEYNRSLTGGFQAALETRDAFAYQIAWQGEYAGASAYSRITRADLHGQDLVDYDDWTSGVQVRYPLFRGVDLIADTSYGVRGNGSIDRVPVDPEQRDDYTTWTTRIGTSFALSRHLDFATYAQHIVRWSSSDALAYERDVFEATLRYFRQF